MNNYWVQNDRNSCFARVFQYRTTPIPRNCLVRSVGRTVKLLEKPKSIYFFTKKERFPDNDS